jgi:hypothetical protein
MITAAVTCTAEAISCESAVTRANETSDAIRTSSVWVASTVVSETLVDI